MRDKTGLYTIFDAAAAAATGKIIQCDDFQHIVFQLGTASSANFTIKIQGSISDTAPDFSAAATVVNHWEYVATIDYLSGSVIAGGTGYTSAGTDVFRTVEANISGLRWICATITARSAGTITLKAQLFDNN